MIKEFILAITLGAILGFGITGSIYALTKSKAPSAPKITPIAITSIDPSIPTSPVATSIPTSTSVPNLTILSPIDNSIVSNSKITLTGTTVSNSVITVSTIAKIFNTAADNNGDFSIDIDLESGANMLNISSVDTNDNQSDSQILVTYSTAKI